MSDRDPRMEPWAGDVLRGPNGKRLETRTIHAVIGGNVYYTPGKIRTGYLVARSLESFQKWAKTAEIVSRGDEREKR